MSGLNDGVIEIYPLHWPYRARPWLKTGGPVADASAGEITTTRSLQRGCEPDPSTPRQSS